MKITKFEAASMKEALAQVKRELGSDAMVISTKQIRRGLLGTGVEVTAAIDGDEPKRQPRSAASETASEQRGGPKLEEDEVERLVAPLRSELKHLRKLLRSANDSRATDDLRKEMIAMRAAMKRMNVGSEEEPIVEVARGHRIAAPSRGRVITLVGPTGVGKTTTIAKLAARSALVEHQTVAIISLDTYRVGSEEQIRVYADLIGVPLYMASHPDELPGIIEGLDDIDMIYVDTAGRSPRDIPAIQQIGGAIQRLYDLEVHLVLASATSGPVIDSIYERFEEIGIDRLLFTKVDEAVDMDEMVRAPARIGKPVTFITTGQAVPEDIEDATQQRLLDLAVNGFEVHANAA